MFYTATYGITELPNTIDVSSVELAYPQLCSVPFFPPNDLKMLCKLNTFLNPKYRIWHYLADVRMHLYLCRGKLSINTNRPAFTAKSINRYVSGREGSSVTAISVTFWYLPDSHNCFNTAFMRTDHVPCSMFLNIGGSTTPVLT